MESRGGVSPDSSTQISERSKKKRKHKHKSKTKHKKLKSSSGENSHSNKKDKKQKKHPKPPSHSEESDEEILDIKPLSGYVEDRKLLHKEVFSLVSKKEVKDMLPVSLKKIKFKEFKNLCLAQLEVMSQKRLRHIIAGQEMLSSSSDESTEPQEQPRQPGVAGNNKQTVKSKVLAHPVLKRKMSILEEMSLTPNQDEIDELIEEPKESAQPQDTQQQANTAGEETEEMPQANDTGQVVAEAELKELEFRARALKSLVIARERQQKLEEQKINETTAT